jgi:sec-independent protein translocase protein TatA
MQMTEGRGQRTEDREYKTDKGNDEYWKLFQQNNSVILKEDSMFGIGLPELSILLVIVLIVFGAGKLPAIGAGVGKSIRNFKNAVTESDKSAEKQESQQITK